MRAHQLAADLLKLPDYDVVDEDAGGVVTAVSESDWEDSRGRKHKCVVIEFEDIDEDEHKHSIFQRAEGSEDEDESEDDEDESEDDEDDERAHHHRSGDD